MVLSGNTQLKLITLTQLYSLYGGLRFLNSISKKWILEWVWPQNVFIMWQMKLTGHFNNKTVGPIRNAMWTISHQQKSTHKTVIQTAVGRCYGLTGVWRFYFWVVVTFFTAAAELTQTEPSAWNCYALRDKKAVFKESSLLVISASIGTKNISLPYFFSL